MTAACSLSPNELGILSLVNLKCTLNAGKHVPDINVVSKLQLQFSLQFYSNSHAVLLKSSCNFTQFIERERSNPLHRATNIGFKNSLQHIKDALHTLRKIVLSPEEHGGIDSGDAVTEVFRDRVVGQDYRSN